MAFIYDYTARIASLEDDPTSMLCSFLNPVAWHLVQSICQFLQQPSDKELKNIIF